MMAEPILDSGAYRPISEYELGDTADFHSGDIETQQPEPLSSRVGLTFHAVSHLGNVFPRTRTPISSTNLADHGRGWLRTYPIQTCPLASTSEPTSSAWPTGWAEHPPGMWPVAWLSVRR